MNGKKSIYPWIAAAVILAFTVYAVLDTFVLSSTLTPEEQTPGMTREERLLTMAVEQGENDTSEFETVTEEEADYYYSDENITVSIRSLREFESDIYVADVRLSSPEYLKTALAGNSYGKNIKATTMDTAEENNAILAINGDYYGARETGYVVRGGILYRSLKTEGSDALAILADGSFLIADEDEVSCSELIDAGAWEVFSFGPGLVTNGEICVGEDDEIGHYQHNNPRTAIGQIDTLHYVFVVVDGRTSESYGLTLYELARVMEELGCREAYNLDGGGSSCMIFIGEEINHPTADGKEFKERKVTDIVYIGY